MASLLLSALPPNPSTGAENDYKLTFTHDLLHAFANLMYHHSSHSKDLQATSALRSTTSGVLAGVHGILHESRALLGLLLCARWGAGVPPTDEPFKQNLERIVELEQTPGSGRGSWTLWWINYLGAVAALVGEVFPAGFVQEGAGGADRLRFQAKWDRDEEKKGRVILALEVSFGAGLLDGPGGADGGGAFGKAIKGVEKVGKRKRWVGGRDGAGFRIDVRVC
jgi:retrograde regulation protein 2